LGKLTYRELNSEDYAKVSQIVANTAADKWDVSIEGYAKSQNISYQEAKDRFALAINVNQAADIAGIFYGLKGSESGKTGISSVAASTLKQLMTKYDEFKQNIASSTKGSNDTLAMAGAGNGSGSPASTNLSPNVNLSTGTSGKSDTKYTLYKNGDMLGANGVRVDSSTIWKGQGKERIDVENPNPGQRAGQLHYQDNKGNKYYYDPITQTFPYAPKSVNALLQNPLFKKAIDKGMTKYLGEK